MQKARCERLYLDAASVAKVERSALTGVLEHLREGDTLLVWRGDGPRRALRQLIDTLVALDQRGIGFKALAESIDTTTVGGRFKFPV